MSPCELCGDPAIVDVSVDAGSRPVAMCRSHGREAQKTAMAWGLDGQSVLRPDVPDDYGIDWTVAS